MNSYSIGIHHVEKIGDRVMLVNIAKREFEGLIGTISGPFIQSKMRWPVKLDDREMKVNLRPANIRLIKYEPPNLDDVPKKHTFSKVIRFKVHVMPTFALIATFLFFKGGPPLFLECGQKMRFSSLFLQNFKCFHTF